MSLIITKEFSNLYEKMVYFELYGHYIIPIEADFWQFHLIHKGDEKYPTLDEIMDRLFINNNVQNENYNHIQFRAVDDIESLLLIEILMKLKISNFMIYHESILGPKNHYIYCTIFEDRVLDYYNIDGYDDFFDHSGFNKDDYLNYEFCKIRYLNLGS